MSEWSLNNGHREDPAPGLLSEELLQDEETLLSFMRDPSLRPNDPSRKARGRTRLPAKKKPPPCRMDLAHGRLPKSPSRSPGARMQAAARRGKGHRLGSHHGRRLLTCHPALQLETVPYQQPLTAPRHWSPRSRTRQPQQLPT